MLMVKLLLLLMRMQLHVGATIGGGHSYHRRNLMLLLLLLLHSVHVVHDHLFGARGMGYVLLVHGLLWWVSGLLQVHALLRIGVTLLRVGHSRLLLRDSFRFACLLWMVAMDTASCCTARQVRLACRFALRAALVDGDRGFRRWARQFRF